MVLISFKSLQQFLLRLVQIGVRMQAVLRPAHFRLLFCLFHTFSHPPASTGAYLVKLKISVLSTFRPFRPLNDKVYVRETFLSRGKYCHKILCPPNTALSLSSAVTMPQLNRYAAAKSLYTTAKSLCRKLRHIKLIVYAFFGKQFLRVSFFHDMTVVHNENAVGVLNRRKPVGNDERRPSF